MLQNISLALQMRQNMYSDESKDAGPSRFHANDSSTRNGSNHNQHSSQQQGPWPHNITPSSQPPASSNKMTRHPSPSCDSSSSSTFSLQANYRKRRRAEEDTSNTPSSSRPRTSSLRQPTGTIGFHALNSNTSMFDLMIDPTTSSLTVSSGFI